MRKSERKRTKVQTKHNNPRWTKDDITTNIRINCNESPPFTTTFPFQKKVGILDKKNGELHQASSLHTYISALFLSHTFICRTPGTELNWKWTELNFTWASKESLLHCLLSSQWNSFSLEPPVEIWSAKAKGKFFLSFLFV